jgi:hypothetical protein
MAKGMGTDGQPPGAVKQQGIASPPSAISAFFGFSAGEQQIPGDTDVKGRRGGRRDRRDEETAKFARSRMKPTVTPSADRCDRERRRCHVGQ